MRKNITYEIYWLRCIACLAVVAVHAITSGINLHAEEVSPMSRELLRNIQMGFMFGTPAFIFISEFLFSKAYQDGLPKGFFIKRIKFLFVPYVIMAVMYAVVFAENRTFTAILNETWKNIFLGEFVAYFIVVILQFYVLHYLLFKKLKVWDMKKVIISTLLINIVYLGFFNFTSTPEDEFLKYVWKRGHWLLIPGWIFYFSLGYYSGKYYESLLSWLHKYRAVVFTAPVIMLSVVILLKQLNLPDIISSKRIDVLFYTTSVIFMIMYFSSKVKQTPGFILFISKYSFSIYLLHKFVVDTAGRISSNMYVDTVILFILGVVFSIVVAHLFNLIPYGKFIVGKTIFVPQHHRPPVKTHTAEAD